MCLSFLFYPPHIDSLLECSLAVWTNHCQSSLLVSVNWYRGMCDAHSQALTADFEKGSELKDCAK